MYNFLSPLPNLASVRVMKLFSKGPRIEFWQWRPTVCISKYQVYYFLLVFVVALYFTDPLDHLAYLCGFHYYVHLKMIRLQKGERIARGFQEEVTLDSSLKE